MATHGNSKNTIILLQDLHTLCLPAVGVVEVNRQDRIRVLLVLESIDFTWLYLDLILSVVPSFEVPINTSKTHLHNYRHTCEDVEVDRFLGIESYKISVHTNFETFCSAQKMCQK